MNKLASLALPCAALLLALSACNKISDDPTPAASRTDLLTSHSWKPSAGTVVYTSTFNGQSDTHTDDAFESCEKDDSFKFGSDKTFVADAGATTCKSSDPQQQTGTWAFSNGDQQLTLTRTAGQPTLFNNADIKELSVTTLHLAGTSTQSLTAPDGTTYTGSYTYDATFVAQ